jgi:hypothetical protein
VLDFVNAGLVMVRDRVVVRVRPSIVLVLVAERVTRLLVIVLDFVVVPDFGAAMPVPNRAATIKPVTAVITVFFILNTPLFAKSHLARRSLRTFV